jgi:ETC complex I subunit conserved region
MTTVHIRKSSKTATQSGKAKKDRWILSFVEPSTEYRDSNVGWSGAHATSQQVTLTFETLVEAEQFATQNEYQYTVDLPQECVTPIKSYADNFKNNRLL